MSQKSPKARGWELLNELPLTDRQRVLYLRGLDKMSEEEAQKTIEELEASIKGLRGVLEIVNILLERET